MGKEVKIKECKCCSCGGDTKRIDSIVQECNWCKGWLVELTDGSTIKAPLSECVKSAFKLYGNDINKVGEALVSHCDEISLLYNNEVRKADRENDNTL